jgi:RNase P subunit RPR2
MKPSSPPTKKRTIKAIEKESEESKVSPSNSPKKMQCKSCYKWYSAQGLGGHRAKAHPGQNKDYQK